MIATRPYDIQNYLTTPEDRAAYLEAVLEDGDPAMIAGGLGDIARAVGVAELSRKTGISREAIYKGFVRGGNPTLDTMAKVAKALGLRLTVVAA